VTRQDSTEPTPAPRKAIRRFDVFAEVNRLEALREGRSEAEAKGHGIWLAKVVAGRRFGQRADRDHHAPPPDRDREADHAEESEGSRSGPAFKSVGNELQTDETFEEEIVERMGPDFYERVFAPAIQAAVARGERYEQFRDTIRKDWKPPR
jgi:hypothetical protein